jgi:hypothetical protein
MKVQVYTSRFYGRYRVVYVKVNRLHFYASIEKPDPSVRMWVALKRAVFLATITVGTITATI